uniref:RNA-directed DNA polymerase n=1 Tax=Strongyloides papillosus TaxID=174720 RepID=A0A0N5BP40_STREA
MIIGSEVIHASEMIIDYKNLSLFVCDRPLKHLSVTKNETKTNNVVASMSIVDDFQLKEIEDLKNEFYDVISFDKNRIGLSKLMAPTLKVVDSNLPKLPRYFLPSHQIPIVEEQISQWLNSGTIKEDFYVKYLQNLVCTRKKDGTWRVCLNCKPLNSKLQDYYYPSPTLKQIIPILSNGDWYTCLDLCQFFTQIGLDDESSQYLGFVALNGKTYKFTRLIYGLKPASSIAQRLINEVTHKFKNVVAYIDDLIVTTRGSFSQHIQDVRNLLIELREMNLVLNGPKCQFACKQVEYLGFKFDSNGMSISDHTTKAMKEYPDIDTHSKMHRFVGKVNYIRYFIPRLAELQKPLDEMIARPKSQFRYTSECQNAFRKIINSIVNATKLQLPDTSRPFTLVTDASHDCYAGILLQESPQHNNKLMPICYFSKRSPAKKKKVPALYMELKAIVKACQYFHQWIINTPTVVLTDHKPLLYVIKDNLDHKLYSYINELNIYNLTIKYIKGSKNILADTLSRAYINRISISENAETLKLQKFDNLSDEQKKEYFKQLHDDMAHLSYHKTYPLLRRRYNWKNIAKEYREYCEKCKVCLERDSPHAGKFKMTSISSSFPMERLTMDVCGPFRKSLSGNVHYLAAIDTLSRYLFTCPIPDTKTDSIIKALQEIIYRAGSPMYLKSDRAKYFESEKLAEFAKDHSIILEKGTAYKHTSQSLVERSFRTLHQLMSKSIEEQNYNKWDELLPKLTFIYNSSIHPISGRAPHDIFHGWSPRLPKDSHTSTDPRNLVDYEETTLQRLASFKIAKEMMVRIREQLSDQEEKEPTRLSTLTPGCKVYIKRPVTRTMLSQKHIKEWQPGFFLRRREGDTCIVSSKKGRQFKLHVDRVKEDPN